MFFSAPLSQHTSAGDDMTGAAEWPVCEVTDWKDQEKPLKIWVRTYTMTSCYLSLLTTETQLAIAKSTHHFVSVSLL